MDKYKPGESINFTNGKKKKKEFMNSIRIHESRSEFGFSGRGNASQSFSLSYSLYLPYSVFSFSFYIPLSISVYIFITDLLLSLIELTDFII